MASAGGGVTALRKKWRFTACAFFCSLVLCACSGDKFQNVLRVDQIRQIDSPVELMEERDTSGRIKRAITAIDGKNVADSLSRDAGFPLLILVMARKLPPDAKTESAGAVSWLYVYKDTAERAWLAIVVDETGIVDAGTSKMDSLLPGDPLLAITGGLSQSEKPLNYWPAIFDWNVDLTALPQNETGTFYALLSVMTGNRSHSVWVEYSDGLYALPHEPTTLLRYEISLRRKVHRVFDAQFGRKFELPAWQWVAPQVGLSDLLKAQVTYRPALWPTKWPPQNGATFLASGAELGGLPRMYLFTTRVTRGAVQ